MESNTQYASISSRKQPANAGSECKQFKENASVVLQQTILTNVLFESVRGTQGRITDVLYSFPGFSLFAADTKAFPDGPIVGDPGGSQSGREKGRDESFQVRAKEPLGTDFVTELFPKIQADTGS